MAAADWAVVPFAVPIDVMVHEYRMAKKPKEMLEILADQNETKAVRIAWILRRCGLDVDARKLPRMINENSFDYDAFWSESADAVVCDRIREQMGRMNEVEEAEVSFGNSMSCEATLAEVSFGNSMSCEATLAEVSFGNSMSCEATLAEVSFGNSMSCEATLMESELPKELVRKDVPPEEEQENGCAEEMKRMRHIKPEKTYEQPEIEEVKPGDMVEIPGGSTAEVADHGVFRIVGELWSIYLDKLRERGVFMLGSVEVLKMQDLERVVHELVEGM